ncbi:hypothetical protein EAH79_11685 [Sphingomonas koreensis]|nr:hypothetical protein EAH79_11685 [Sphingomonas koreensis]
MKPIAVDRRQEIHRDWVAEDCADETAGHAMAADLRAAAGHPGFGAHSPVRHLEGNLVRTPERQVALVDEAHDGGFLRIADQPLVDQVVAIGRRPTDLPPGPAQGVRLVPDAVAQHLPLELREREQDVQHQSAEAGRCGTCLSSSSRSQICRSGLCRSPPFLALSFATRGLFAWTDYRGGRSILCNLLMHNGLNVGLSIVAVVLPEIGSAQPRLWCSSVLLALVAAALWSFWPVRGLARCDVKPKLE